MELSELSIRELSILQAALTDYSAMRARFAPKAYAKSVRELRDKVDAHVERRCGTGSPSS